MKNFEKPDNFDPSMNVEKEFGESYYPYMDDRYEEEDQMKSTKFDPKMNVGKEFGEEYWPFDERPQGIEEFKFKPKKKVLVKVRRVK